MTTQPDSQHSPPHCPYLGVEASNHRLGEAVEYPSFENRCWTTPRPIPLLLTDQATLCLCNGYHHCPRFLAARAARQGQERPATVPPPADSDSITSALKELEADVQAATTAQTKSRRRWGWIGAGLIFMSSLLCGGLFAGYVGWQMVRDEITATQPGEINTLATSAQAQTSTQPPIYIIQTATSTSQPNAIAQVPDTSQATDGNAPVYPVAVQPTPAPDGSVPNQPPPSLSQIAEETNAQETTTQGSNDSVPLPSTGPTPILDFGLEVPTRRPTPLLLDIPTSTPSLEEMTPTPQPTSTPMPPMGTPLVIFYAEDPTMEPGDCTTVHWNVQNVKEVYYENLGVDGQGQKEECVRDDPGDYNLLVIFGNGATQAYTLTVAVVAPTDTPKPTPTRTEEPLPTPTWTPNVPAATPTPPTQYGARLEAGDDTKLSCPRGATCDIDFYAANIGSAIDTITVRFTEASSWPHQLCRLDGVCSESQMTLVDMGLSSTGVVRLNVTIPADALLETLIYKVQAVSEKSGGTTTSSIITIEITATE